MIKFVKTRFGYYLLIVPIVFVLYGVIYYAAPPRLSEFQSADLTFEYPSRYRITYEPETNSISVGNILTVSNTFSNATTSHFSPPIAQAKASSGIYPFQDVANGSTLTSTLGTHKVTTFVQGDTRTSIIEEQGNQIIFHYKSNDQKVVEEILASVVVASPINSYEGHDHE